MEKSYTLEELNQLGQSDEIPDNSLTLEDLDNVNSWSIGASALKEAIFDFGKGVAGDLARIPDEIGQLIIEEGEKGHAGFAIPSLRDGFNIADRLTGKDMERSKSDELIISAGQMLSKKSSEFVSSLDLQPDENSKLSKLMFDLGSGAASVATSLGLIYATRSPSVVGFMFGARQKAQIYKESRMADKNPEEASAISTMAGIVEGGVESLGGAAFLRSIALNKFAARALLRAGEQGLEEGIQQLGEESITKLFKIRKDSFKDSVLRVGYATALGIVLGVPAGIISTSYEKTQIYKDLKALGLNNKQIKDLTARITDKMIQDKSVNKELANFITEEIKKTEKIVNERKNELLAEDEEAEIKKTVEEGGGIYKGYQAPKTLKSGKVIGDFVYFNTPETETTLVLKKGELTAENVKKKIAESDEKFKKAESTEDALKKTEAENKTLTEQIKTLKKKKQLPQMSVEVENLITPISSRLGRISEKLKTKLRKFESGTVKKIYEAQKRIVPFLEKYQSLSSSKRKTLDLALKNREKSEIEVLIKDSDLAEEYNQARELLNEIYEEAKKVEIDIGFLEDYWPRHINDPEGLIEYFEDQDIWPDLLNAIETKSVALGRQLTNEESAQLINSLIRGYGGGKITLSKPGSLKTREIETITPEINEFYSGSADALSIYVNRLIDFIETRKFFGRFAKKADLNTLTLDETIGGFVLDLLHKGDITSRQAEEVSEILKARFANKGVNGWWQVLKNISYIDTMGNFGSAVTQIGDLTYSFYKNGFYTFPALLNKKLITREDLGLDRIVQEFSETKDWSSEALRKVFKITGLEWMDKLGKETYINSSYLKYQELAKNNDPDFKNQMKLLFEDESSQVIDDFKSGKVSENVKFVLFSDLSDVQPVTLSELPVTYLRSGNGRIFYMLKTFFLKHIDLVRTQSIDLMAQGKVKEGLGNLFRLMILFMMMNGSADVIKDLLFNRPIKPSDLVVDNFVRFLGFSKYGIYKAKDEGFQGVVTSFVPPFGRFAFSFIKDVERDIKNSEFDPNQWDTIQSIPIGGKLYYWWFGRGKTKMDKKRKKKGFKR